MSEGKDAKALMDGGWRGLEPREAARFLASQLEALGALAAQGRRASKAYRETALWACHFGGTIAWNWGQDCPREAERFALAFAAAGSDEGMDPEGWWLAGAAALSSDARLSGSCGHGVLFKRFVDAEGEPLAQSSVEARGRWAAVRTDENDGSSALDYWKAWCLDGQLEMEVVEGPREAMAAALLLADHAREDGLRFACAAFDPQGFQALAGALRMALEPQDLRESMDEEAPQAKRPRL